MAHELQLSDGHARAAEPRSGVSDDAGVPAKLVHWAIMVGVALTAAGAAIIILTDRAPHLGALMTCVGFGIILAAFGARASGGWQKLTATGAGALAIGLFLIHQQYAPAPIEFKKRGQISGDVIGGKTADFRIIDEEPLYSFRDRNSRSLRFVMLEKQFRTPQLTVQVETNEQEPDKQFFEMFSDGKAVAQRYFASSDVIKWIFDYEDRTIKDGNDVIFRVPDRLDENRIGAARPRPSFSGLSPIGSAWAGMVEARDVPQLITDLKSGNPALRRNARDELVVAGPGGVKPMMEAWRQSPDDYQVKLGVAYALNGMLRNKGADLKAIARALGDDDIALLVRAANDDDKTLRLQAAEFLFKLRDPRIVAPSLQAVREAKNPDGVYNSVLILKPVVDQLQAPEQRRIKSELDANVPMSSPRTRSLVDQIVK